MKISGTGPIRSSPARPGKAKPAMSGGSFSASLASEAPAASTVASAAPVNPIDGILAVQEVNDATDGRSRGINRGHGLLDRLDELRHGLLAGTIDRDRLLRLRREIAEKRVALDDSRLSAILDEIDLRAAVELAKLGIT